MTAPTTIERLSQRQYEAFWERQPQRDPPTPYTPWNEQAEAIKSMWRDIVRAVLVDLYAAPDFDALAYTVDPHVIDGLVPSLARDAWEAGVDQILSEPAAGSGDVGREGGK